MSIFKKFSEIFGQDWGFKTQEGVVSPNFEGFGSFFTKVQIIAKISNTNQCQYFVPYISLQLSIYPFIFTRTHFIALKLAFNSFFFTKHKTAKLNNFNCSLKKNSQICHINQQTTISPSCVNENIILGTEYTGPTFLDAQSSHLTHTNTKTHFALQHLPSHSLACVLAIFRVTHFFPSLFVFASRIAYTYEHVRIQTILDATGRLSKRKKNESTECSSIQVFFCCCFCCFWLYSHNNDVPHKTARTITKLMCKVTVKMRALYKY